MDVVALARRSVDLVTPLAQRKRIAVTCSSEAPAVHVVADHEKLTQVLLNLLDNAVKYTEPGGSVDVSVSAAGGRAVIRVRDTGIGIPPEDRLRIFERFYRVDRARSRESGGTGLGLSIVKHIVEAHRGTVTVESRPGHGSTFMVSLPQEGASPSNRPAEPVQESAGCKAPPSTGPERTGSVREDRSAGGNAADGRSWTGS